MLNRIFDHLEEGIIAFLLASMTLVTFTQVVLRYLNSTLWPSPSGQFLLENLPFLQPFPTFHMVWALELTTYLFAWLVLFGMSFGVKVGAHIGIDAFTRLLPQPWQQRLAVLALLTCLLYSVLLFIGGTQYVYKIYQAGWLSEDLPIPQWTIYLILPIGFLLLFWRLSQALFRLLQGHTMQLLADEAQDTLKNHQITGPLS